LRKASPMSIVGIFVLGGAYARADDADTAFGGSRDVAFVVNIEGATPSPDGYEAERAWVRAYWSDLVQHAGTVGSYVNFMTEHEDDRVRAAYGDKYERLQQLKVIYDPDNVFHLNANITPS
ncbi:MAG: BBE domain-containing protein, partial [Acidimicrobiales bacterium]